MTAIPTIDGKRVYENYDAESDVLAGPWDAIVIGSGMGGMSCAASLAHYGWKVLVLEQHYVAGGFTHSFARKGFVWDAGVHAIGEMREQDVPGKMLRWLTGGKVEMVSLGDPYDRFSFFDGFDWGLPESRERYVAQLKQAFPEQDAALERYLAAVEEASQAALLFFAMKSFPEGLEGAGRKVLDTLFGAKLIKGEKSPFDWWELTTSEVLDACGVEGKLRTVLTLHWGYYGSTPNESAFPIHALTHSHFWNGAYYPKGGSKEFAAQLLNIVNQAGGRTLVKASVRSILVEQGRAVGVVMEDGTRVRAPVVISAAGAKTTLKKLAPKSLRESDYAKEILALPDSPPYICLNIGFQGDIRAAGAASSNRWFFETWDNEDRLWDLTDKDSRAPILYCSFPSLKDPLYDPGPKQKHTGECVTFVDWDLFTPYLESELFKRPEAYEEFKREIEDRLVAHLKDRMPELMELMVYCELSTPLTTQHFTAASQGAIYGLAATPARFTCRKLRTRTPLKGFYLSGVDIASLGVVGAMTTGMLTAASLDPRVYLHLI